MTSTGYLRYLTASVIFGAVLAGRYVTLWWSADHPPVQRRTVVAVGAIATACFLAANAVQLSQPAPGPPAVRLAAFLESHGLTSGVGDFWASSLTTVESGNAVAVRPVVPGPDATLEAYNKGDNPGWFAGHSFQFAVYRSTTAASNPTQVSLSTASATWGSSVHDVRSRRLPRPRMAPSRHCDQIPAAYPASESDAHPVVGRRVCIRLFQLPTTE